MTTSIAAPVATGRVLRQMRRRSEVVDLLNTVLPDLGHQIRLGRRHGTKIMNPAPSACML